MLGGLHPGKQLPFAASPSVQGCSKPRAAVGAGHECVPGIWPDCANNIHSGGNRQGKLVTLTGPRVKHAVTPAAGSASCHQAPLTAASKLEPVMQLDATQSSSHHPLYHTQQKGVAVAELRTRNRRHTMCSHLLMTPLLLCRLYDASPCRSGTLLVLWCLPTPLLL